MKKLIKVITIYTPLILITIKAIIVSVFLFQQNTNYGAVLKFLMVMGIEFIWFLIGKNVADDDTHTKFQNELSDLNTKFEDELSELNKNMRYFNNASMEVLTTYDDFYRKLQKSRLTAREKVQLTQLDPEPPSAYGDQRTRKEYFEGDVAYCQNHPDVNFYRILSIETEEKLEWAKTLITNMQSLPNVFLAYINIGSEGIEKMTPFPKLLSLQIIDCEEVFMLDPRYSYMPHAYKNCCYFKNKDVALIYSEYYETIWETIRRDEQHGYILKDGNSTRGYEEKLNKIKINKGWGK